VITSIATNLVPDYNQTLATAAAVQEVLQGTQVVRVTSIGGLATTFRAVGYNSPEQMSEVIRGFSSCFPTVLNNFN
jgi:hypothetical protein